MQRLHRPSKHRADPRPQTPFTIMAASSPDKSPSKEEATIQQSFLSSIKESWSNFTDEQRLERLDQCRILEGLLSDCRRRGQAKQATDDDKPSLHTEPMGIRMLRYFQWRELDSSQYAPCRREEHAVWACRAIALRCGRELTDFKSCVDKCGPSILKSETVYEGTTSGVESGVPCGDFQQAIGACVAKNAKEMQQRRNKQQPVQS